MDNQNYKGGFYKIPRRFFTPECPLDLEAKVLYVLIADRISISLKNGWHDENGRLYCYLSVKEASDFLGCGENKARRMFKQLEYRNFISSIHQGQGKPNRLYLTSSPERFINHLYNSVSVPV